MVMVNNFRALCSRVVLQVCQERNAIIRLAWGIGTLTGGLYTGTPVASVRSAIR